MAGISKFTAERGDKICELIALGKSMRTVCAVKGMPAPATVYKWLRENPKFAEQYACAREDAADAFVEDIIDIADDGVNDYVEMRNKKGEVIGYAVNKEAIQRSRVRIDTRKWLAMKLKPKKYGDRLAVEANSKIEGSVTHRLEDATDEELRAVAAAYAQSKADDGK